MAITSKTYPFKRNKYIFILALFFMGVRINLIGSISITEIFVLTQIPHILKWCSQIKFPKLRIIINLFILLIVSQIISEYIIQNTIENAMKGIAVTIMALLLFLFFLEKIIKDPTLLKWIPICNIISLIVWGDQFGFANNDEASYFKFYIAPIIASCICYLTMKNSYIFRKNPAILFFVGGIFMIIGGARSLGFSVLISGMIVSITYNAKNIRFKKLIPVLIISGIIFQLFYANIYIPKVKSGEWGSKQNQAQLAAINYSTNPLMMIFIARTDFFVSWKAFMDKPIFGHGSWAKDQNLKYFNLTQELASNDASKTHSIQTTPLVPIHSVVIGMGTRNGILAFILFLIIFINVYYIGISTIRRTPKSYTPFLIYTIITSFQLLLFGPPANLKNSGSIAFAIIFALFYLSSQNKSIRK